MREVAAVASGVFVGCLPAYGFHLLICGSVGTALKLNRLKMYLAANISNPVMAPLLVFLEIQAGAWLRRGSFHAVSVETVKTTAATTFGADLVLGSIAVGAVLAAIAGWCTYMFVVRASPHDEYSELVRLAAERYVDAGLVAWEFARVKLKRDPVYRACVCGGLFTSSCAAGALLDVGCGQGLALALLVEAREAHVSGRWPAIWPPPPTFEAMVGIDMRPRVAAIASEALRTDAQIMVCDAREVTVVQPQAILLFDVLHLMTREDQESLLARLATALAPRGVMLIREADAAAGWRFQLVRWGNWLKAVAYGSWNQPFHFRTAVEWQACLVEHGLQAEVREMSEGTPFANVLFRVTRIQS
jgi:SAM-dependent methyltransferase